MSAQQDAHLPYYTHDTSESLEAIAKSLSLVEQNEILLFEHLCLYAHKTNNGYIKVQDFVLYLSQWADHNAYGPFRLSRNIYRQMNVVVEVLEKNFYCQSVVAENELVSVTLIEPESSILENWYMQMTLDSKIFFPTKDIYKHHVLDSLFEYCNIDNFTFAVIEQVIAQKKILVVSFPSNDSHILVPYSYLKKLNGLAAEKLEYFVEHPQNNKMIEDIIHKVKPLMQNVNLNIDKILRLLYEKDNDPPRYLFYFTRELSLQLAQYSQKKIDLYHSSRLLERFQASKEEKVIAEKNAILFADVHAKIEMILKDKTEFMERNELLSFYESYTLKNNEEINFKEISFEEFDSALSEFLSETTERQAEQILSKVVRVYFDGAEYIIHSENIVAAFQKTLYDIFPQSKQFYLDLFYSHLVKNQTPRYLKDDHVFAEHVEKRVQQKYPELTIFLKNPTIVYNAFFISSAESSHMNYLNQYFIQGDKHIFKSTFLLLNLRREELYRQAYTMLPYSQKFLVIRILKNLFHSLKMLFLSKERRVVAKSARTSVATQAQEPTDKMQKELDDLQLSICKDLSFDQKMNELERRWNIKIGEAHQKTKEEVITETNLQVAKLAEMIQKLKQFDVKAAQEVFRSVAIKIKKRYPEIRDHKALEEYIVLTASRSLKSRFRKL